MEESSVKGRNKLRLDEIAVAAAIAVVTFVLALPTCVLLLGSIVLAYALSIAAAVLALSLVLLTAHAEEIHESPLGLSSYRGPSVGQVDGLGLRAAKVGALLGVSTWLVGLGAFVVTRAIPSLALALDVVATVFSTMTLFFAFAAIAIVKAAEERRSQWRKSLGAFRVFSVGIGLSALFDALAATMAFLSPDRYGWFELLAFLAAFVAMISALLSWDNARSVGKISAE